MTDDTAKKDTLKVANPGRLQLTKTVESGKVKQNFTHGRSKSVTVEVRKTRTFAQGAGGMVEVKSGGATAGSIHDDEALRHLTPEERNSRLKALKIAEEQMKLAQERAQKEKEEQAEKKRVRGEGGEGAVNVPMVGRIADSARQLNEDVGELAAAVDCSRGASVQFAVGGSGNLAGHGAAGAPRSARRLPR